MKVVLPEDLLSCPSTHSYLLGQIVETSLALQCFLRYPHNHTAMEHLQLVVPVVSVEQDQELSLVHLFGHKVELVWVVLVKQMFIGMELP